MCLLGQMHTRRDVASDFNIDRDIHQFLPDAEDWPGDRVG